MKIHNKTTIRSFLKNVALTLSLLCLGNLSFADGVSAFDLSFSPPNARVGEEVQVTASIDATGAGWTMERVFYYSPQSGVAESVDVLPADAQSFTFPFTPTEAGQWNFVVLGKKPVLDPITGEPTGELEDAQSDFAVLVVVLNNAPTVTAPEPITVPCTSGSGAKATLTAVIGDADADELTVEWAVDGVVVATHTLAAGTTPDTTDSLVDQAFGFGEHTVTVTVSDGQESATASTTVTVTPLPAGGILWLAPLARKGMTQDTDPSAGGTRKYVFKRCSTIPIQIKVTGCCGDDVTRNSNISGKVAVFGDVNGNGQIEGEDLELAIYSNGVGGAGGVMDKIGGKLKFNLNTGKLPVQTSKSYVLQVTVTDGTGASIVEILGLQAK